MSYRDERDARIASLESENMRLYDLLAVAHADLEQARQEAQRPRLTAYDLLSRVSGYWPILLVAVIVAITWGLWPASDELRAGYVVARHHRTAYTTTICTSSGRTTICNPVHHRERWWVVIAVEDKQASVDLEEPAWSRVHGGRWYRRDD